MTAIPVCFVTGFLGSGKTTFIQRLVEQYHSKKIVYLVNEFSPKDIDGERLNLPADELVKIPGGSIFCKCLTGQFLKVLRQVSEMAVDGVVIEASGIANPRVAGDMFKETKLDEVFAIRSIVAIVDPRSFQKLCRTLPNIKEQIAAATQIIINKIDKFSAEKIDETVSSVCKFNSTASILKTEFCKADIDVFADFGVVGSGGDYAKCKDPNFCQVTINVADMESFGELKRKLSLLGDDLYRVKGCVSGADNNLIAIDYDGGDWSQRIDGVSRAEESGSLVVIASGYRESTLQGIRERFG